MGIKIAVVKVTLPTATGNFNITTTDLGGLTPKAVMFVNGINTTNGNNNGHASMSVGCADGTNQWAMAVIARNGISPNDTWRRGTTLRCITQLSTSSGNLVADATFVSFITNGCTINITDAFPNAYLLTAIFFAGTDLSVQCGTIIPTGPDGTVTSATMGFNPDSVIFSSEGSAAWGNTSIANMYPQMGFAVNGGTIEQGCITQFSKDAVTPASCDGIVFDNRIAGIVADNVLERAIELTSFQSDGFSVTMRAGSNSTDLTLGYLALNYNGKVTGKKVTLTTSPTTTGNASTTIGFEPQFVMLYSSHLSALGSIQTGVENVLAADVSMITPTVAHNQSIADEDASATSDSQNRTEALPITTPLPNGSAGLVSSTYSFGATDYTINYTTVHPTAKYMVVFAIGIETTGTTFNQVLSGSITPAGVLIRSTQKKLSGSIASAGTLTEKAIKALSGVVTSTGNLVKTSRKRLTGSITPSGILNRARVFFRALTGTVGSSGTLVRRTTKVLAGNVTSAGGLRRITLKRLGGVIGSSGVLNTARVFLRVLSGVVGSSGNLRKVTVRKLTGTITSSGTLIKLARKVLSGVVGISGTVLTNRAKGKIRQLFKGPTYSENKLSFSLRSAPWNPTNYYRDLTQEVVSYDHTLNAVGGFWSSNLSLKLPVNEIEEWLENGIGRELIVKGRASSTAFEGIVNRISFQVGGYDITIGPFSEIANRVKIVYSSIIQLGDGEVTGIRLETDYLDDANSQAKYGILVKNFSTGGVQETAVAGLRQMLLDRFKLPGRSEDLNAPGVLSDKYFDVKIECLGYVHMFQKYLYNNTTLTGTQNLSDKLRSIIVEDPNSLFTIFNIDENVTQVKAYENDDAEAWGLIKGLVTLGDTNFYRYTFTCYEKRRINYKIFLDEIVYYKPVRDGIGVIQDRNGGILEPWEIRPGVNILVVDLLPGKPLPSEVSTDHRVIFAETVQFRMPNSLIINGSHFFKVEQRLAQLGIKGIS